MRLSHPRNAGIDLLRGTSILLVVCHHISLRLPLANSALALIAPDRFIRMLSWSGGKAVVMFFTISGFLITRRAVAVHGSLSTLKPILFYQHRANRILPLLLILIAVLGLLNLTGWDDYTFRPPQSFSWATFAVLTAHFNWYEIRTDHYPPANWDVLWSLSVEEAFYLAFPFICRLPSKVLTVLLLCLVAYGPIDEWLLRSASDMWQDKAYGPGFAAIATGILAALLRAKVTTLSKHTGIMLVGLGLTLLILALFYGHELSLLLGPVRPLCLITGMGILLLGLDYHPLPKGLCRATAWVQSCGRHSYEIYLSHMFVVLPVVMLWQAVGGQHAASLIVFPIVIFISIALGATIFTRISRPVASFFDTRAQ